jgi:hypothetical protein
MPLSEISAKEAFSSDEMGVASGFGRRGGSAVAWRRMAYHRLFFERRMLDCRGCILDVVGAGWTNRPPVWAA